MNRRPLHFFLLAVLLLCLPGFGQAQTCHYRSHGPALLPDPSCTPGVDNPAVTQATIKETICKPGWTKTVRPPVSYTDELKAELMVAYGDTVPQVPPLGSPPDIKKCISHSDDKRCYELDHAEALTDGGHPGKPKQPGVKNLWPQPYWPKPAAHEKDAVEVWLNKQVCSGKITLDEDRMMLRTDWYAAYLYMQKMKAKAK